MIKNKTTLQQNRGRNASLALERTLWDPMLILLHVLAVVALIACSALPLGATTTEADADAYGFVSRVDGEVLLSGLEGDEAIEAEINHPLLTGDQITTNSGRIELILPDGTVVRIARGTSIVFDALSGAPDSEIDGGTLLALDQGELQIRTPETFLTDEDLAVRTPNATVYLAPAGSYRVTSQDSSFTEVVVREGFAEAQTVSGSGIARDGEALEISGYARPFVNTVDAGPADSLELWASDLDRAAYEASSDEIDPRLAYAAAPLEEAGEWVEVESYRAWRPYVRADWRPFRYGRWVYTPSGLTWVASAPWGWVTSHYGSWDYRPGYGWLWLPGNFYTPAAVHWYWGPTHVAWIPSGYYSRHYRSGFGFGVYGWAGGDWGYWTDWTFCPTRYFGRRGYDRYWNSGRNMARQRRFAVPRGIVTTDTRGLGPERWGKPTEVLDTLVKRAAPRGTARDLPDVTEFVARRKVAMSRTTDALDRRVSARERLQPLPEERKRGRLGSRSVATDTSTRVRSRDGSSTLSRTTGRKEPSAMAGTRYGGTIRRPGDRVRSSPGKDTESRARVKRQEAPSARAPSSSLERSVAPRTTPVRRVLDRIREHREATRGSSSEKSAGSSRATSPSNRSSSASDGGKSSSVSKNPRGSSSKAPTRSSSSSARASGSSRSSAQKSAPPSRSSSKPSSSGRSSSRSRSKSRSKN
jgi:hypothetical protein